MKRKKDKIKRCKVKDCNKPSIDTVGLCYDHFSEQIKKEAIERQRIVGEYVQKMAGILDPDKEYKVEQVRKIFGLRKQQTIREWIEKGELTGRKISGSNYRIKIEYFKDSRDQLIAWTQVRAQGNKKGIEVIPIREFAKLLNNGKSSKSYQSIYKMLENDDQGEDRERLDYKKIIENLRINRAIILKEKEEIIKAKKEDIKKSEEITRRKNQIERAKKTRIVLDSEKEAVNKLRPLNVEVLKNEIDRLEKEVKELKKPIPQLKIYIEAKRIIEAEKQDHTLKKIKIGNRNYLEKTQAEKILKLSKDYVTREEASRILGCNIKTIDRKIKAGKIPAKKLGKNWFLPKNKLPH